MGRLSGKMAIVTGADAQGLGRGNGKAVAWPYFSRGRAAGVHASPAPQS